MQEQGSWVSAIMGVDIILVGETTKELKATLYEIIFGDICHQFIIVNYVLKIKHNNSFTSERFNTVPRYEIPILQNKP